MATHTSSQADVEQLLDVFKALANPVRLQVLQRHLDAGADHVGIQVVGVEPGTSAMPHWRRLAEALLPA